MTRPLFEDSATREGIEAMTLWGEWGTVDDVANCAVFLLVTMQHILLECLW